MYVKHDLAIVHRINGFDIYDCFKTMENRINNNLAYMLVNFLE